MTLGSSLDDGADARAARRFSSNKELLRSPPSCGANTLGEPRAERRRRREDRKGRPTDRLTEESEGERWATRRNGRTPGEEEETAEGRRDWRTYCGQESGRGGGWGNDGATGYARTCREPWLSHDGAAAFSTVLSLARPSLASGVLGGGWAGRGRPTSGQGLCLRHRNGDQDDHARGTRDVLYGARSIS